MEKSRIIELMAKKTGKCATAEELAELATLLSAYPDYAHFYEILQSLRGSRNHFEKNIPKDELVSNGWQQLADRLNTQPTPDNEHIVQAQKGLLKQLAAYPRKWVSAAAIIIFAGGSLLFYQNYQEKLQSASSTKIAQTKYGATSQVTLADGSKVRLNAGSRLIYPARFSNTQREVTLEGEAFFEVTKNPHAPFLVHAGKITLRVLGTVFNVKAYKEDADIETTLISGKVQVMLNDEPEKKIILSPHEKLTVINARKTDTAARAQDESVSNKLRYEVQQLPAAGNDSFVETAWLSNKLVLNNEDFENVASLLERKYNVKIYFDDNSLKQEHVSGVFEKENIMQVLEVLKMTTRFNYRIEGNNIHLF